MITSAKKFLLNTNWPVGFKVRLGSELAKTKNVLKAQFDFSVLGGAQGSVTLKDEDGADATLPSGAIITRVWIDSITDPTSGGAATVALSSEGAADLLAATAIAGITGIIEGLPDGTAAQMIKLTAAREIVAVIATADLTAGKFNVFIEFVLSE